MDVVEDQDYRVGARHGGEQLAHRLEESVALVLGIARSRHPEPGHPRREVREHPGELSAEWAELGLQALDRHRPGVVAQRLGERPERGAQLLVAATPQHRRPGLQRPAHQLGHEPGLADARLARDEHGATGALRRLLPRGEQGFEGRSAAGEREGRSEVDESGQRDTRDPAGHLPFDVADRQRLRESLERPDPSGVTVYSLRVPARARTRSLTRIWLPSASAQRRAASTTGVPNQSPSSKVASPALTPTRMVSGLPSSCRLRRSTARCMATAPASASAAPR